jgi:alkylhydroperoxidase family enzyme
VGRAAGVSEAQLLDLARYATSAAFDPTERLVLDLAVAMAQTPTDVPNDLRQRLREQFDDTQLVELAAAIAWEHYRARFNRVFGVQPAGFSEGAFCVLPER